MKQKTKKQILVISGGNVFNSKESFHESLKLLTLKNISEMQSRKQKWTHLLQKRIGIKYQVYLPKFPNRDNADYKEWKILFENLISQLENDSVIIGYSLGAIFLVKFFEEKGNYEKYKSKIKLLIFVASPYDDEKKEDLGNFKITKELENLTKIQNILHFFYSKDDPIVKLTEYENYKKDLPNANYYILNKHEHFWFPEFPELVRLIKGLK